MSNFIVDNSILVGIKTPEAELIIPQNNVQIYGNEYYSSTNFGNCITSIKSEDNCNLRSILRGCFYHFEKLQSIDFSKCPYLSSIGNRAFCGCISLKSVKFPSSIESIESAAFSTTGLEITFIITDKLKHFDGGSFFYSNVSFALQSSTILTIYENNVYLNNYETLVAVSYSTKLLSFHQNTKAIGYCSFSSASLECLTVNENLTLNNNAYTGRDH